MPSDDEVLKQVGKSGFPFQLKVEQVVLNSQRDHHWTLASREHPWVNPETTSSGFIDLVLQHEQFTTFRLVVECKRVKADDSRQLRWIFLYPDSALKPTELASCLEVEGWIDRASTTPTWNDARIWDTVRVFPDSLQSEFCILPSDEQRRQPILESLAAGVLDSTEGLADEEVKITISQNHPNRRLFIFPVIVTNAELAVCQFDSAAVDVSDGTLDPTGTTLSAVPFIRFRKSLDTHFPEGRFADLYSANRARERTVFVVNAASLPAFLTNWRLEPQTVANGFAIQRIAR